MDVFTTPADSQDAVTPDPHTHHSSYREMLLEHLFIGELLRYLWKCKIHQVEVLKSQVDDSGYDLVMEYQTILRHIQLKASYHGAKTSRVPINTKLGTKPSGCIIWIIFDAAEMTPVKYLWSGGAPGEKLPDVMTLRTGKHQKANAQGVKTERANIRVVERKHFVELTTINEVAARLFGIAAQD